MTRHDLNKMYVYDRKVRPWRKCIKGLEKSRSANKCHCVFTLEIKVKCNLGESKFLFSDSDYSTMEGTCPWQPFTFALHHGKTWDANDLGDEKSEAETRERKKSVR